MTTQINERRPLHKKLEDLFLFFMMYSCIGWIYELGLCIKNGEGFVNRGFCLGPWLPIYGIGGILIILLFYVHKKRVNIFVMLVLTTAFAAFVELLTTYILDFAGVGYHILWDYSDRFMNFDGRIALWPAAKFGIMATILIYFVQPSFEKLVVPDRRFKNAVAIGLAVIFVCDAVYHVIFGSNFSG